MKSRFFYSSLVFFRECIRGVGEAVLRKAFEILENADDDTLEVSETFVA